MKSFIVTVGPFILALLSATAIGLWTEMTNGALSRAYQRLRLRLGGQSDVPFDARQDGLFPLGVWSPARQLEPGRLLTEIVPREERPVQPWIDPEILEDAVRSRAEHHSGATLYFAGFRIDHRESPETQVCRVRQAESEYPEVLALEDLRIRRPELFRLCDEAIERHVGEYMVAPVPSSVAVNLVVVSDDNKILCVERSAATDSSVGWWTVGVFETMKQPDPNRPGAFEDIYGLAARGLIEELGLYPGDYGKIVVSWVGILRIVLRGHIVAIVKLKVPRERLAIRAQAAHSGYEHAAIDWLPLSRSTIQSFKRATRHAHLGKVGFTLSVGGRTFIEQSRLAVLEAWRFQMVLED